MINYIIYGILVSLLLAITIPIFTSMPITGIFNSDHVYLSPKYTYYDCLLGKELTLREDTPPALQELIKTYDCKNNLGQRISTFVFLALPIIIILGFIFLAWLTNIKKSNGLRNKLNNTSS